MNQLFVLSFDTEEAAFDALHSLRGLEGEDRIHFEDTAVVTRDPDGAAMSRTRPVGPRRSVPASVA